MKLSTSLLIYLVFLLVSCGLNDRTEANLSPGDVQYIRGLGLLDSNEVIQFFESHGTWKDGFKQAGGFITEKRIAYYWLDDNADKQQISSALFSDIDSIRLINNSRSLTYASYIQVYRSNDLGFKAYFDVDSTRLLLLYRTAKANWKARH